MRRASVIRLRRSAFTIVELLVALGVTVLALSIVTTVFGLTQRTAAQSQALAEVQNRLRSVLDDLKSDLEACDPAESILYIHGRVQPGALSQEDLDNRRYFRVLVGDEVRKQPNFDPERTPGTLNPPRQNVKPIVNPDLTQYSDPRADVLAFFTNRPGISNSPPRAAATNNFNGAQIFSRQFVTYGHAAIDSVALDTSSTPPRYDFASGLNTRNGNNIEHLTQTRTDGSARSRLPMQRWVLARRGLLIRNVDEQVFNLNAPLRTVSVVNGVLQPGINTNVAREIAARGMTLTDGSFDNVPGDIFQLDLTDLLRAFTFDPTVLAGFNAPSPVDYSPYSDVSLAYQPGGGISLYFATSPFNYRNILDALIYPPNDDPRTGFGDVAVVAENPPAGLSPNLGMQALAGCAWFQVEFLMPEDVRNARDYVDLRQRDLGSGSAIALNSRSDLPRWVSVPPGETYVFAPDSSANRTRLAELERTQNGNVRTRAKTFAPMDFDPPPAATPQPNDTRRFRLWPYGVRITVRAIDPQGRLREPIAATLVHRFPD